MLVTVDTDYIDLVHNTEAALVGLSILNSSRLALSAS